MARIEDRDRRSGSINQALRQDRDRDLYLPKDRQSFLYPLSFKMTHIEAKSINIWLRYDQKWNHPMQRHPYKFQLNSMIHNPRVNFSLYIQEMHDKMRSQMKDHIFPQKGSELCPFGSLLVRLHFCSYLSQILMDFSSI